MRAIRHVGTRLATTIAALVSLGAAAALVVEGPTVKAQAPPPAGGYMFTLISIGPGGGTCGGPLNGNPAMNDEGLVAYPEACGAVTLGDGFQEDVLVDGPGGCTGNPCLIGIAPNLSINNAREVAMQVVVFDNPTGSFRDWILTATPGVPVVAIRLRQEDTPYGHLYLPRINEAGSISLGASTPSSETAVLRLDGTVPSVMVDPTIQTPLGPVSPGLVSAINDSGLVALFGSSPHSVLRTNGVGVSVIDNQGADTGIPSINNDGLVAYINALQQVVTNDGTSAQVIARSFATDPLSPVEIFQQANVNNDGLLAFLAKLRGGAVNYGIFTGPDFVANKVVQTGDVLPIVPGGFQVQQLRLGPEGFNDVGQIVFFADGLNASSASQGRVIVRADPPGSTPANPILPTNPAPPWRIPIVGGTARSGWPFYGDPHLAIGYHYEIDGPGASNFASVVIPGPLPQGDNTFQVAFAGQSAVLTAGVPFDFTTTIPGGVPEFTITGIDEAELLDPDDATAFVTGWTFADAFDGNVLMTPLTEVGTDTTAPTLTLPADIVVTATSPDGRLVTYAATATDDTDPAPTVVCTPASGTTFPIGTTTVTCSATDASDNSASGTVDVTVAYDFVGLLSPASNLPAVNSAKAGSSVPIRFSLVGDMGLDVLAPGSPASQATTCEGGASTATIEEAATAGQSSLSYDPLTDEYTYVWKTSRAWVGTCRQLLLTLRDGSTHTARFAFPR